MSAEKMLTIKELAAELDVPVATIYGWRSRKDGQGDAGPRAAKVGRSLRFRRSDVDAWLERRMDEAS